ncbi:hypothetical protein GQR58_020782 [Nymphon striatum]|nr:hypothetical protein GQR58_020782 [Nymphon striatum]
MRMVTSSKETQLVPGFGSFISATDKKLSRKSTIDYFNPINQPLTEYSVIRELLKSSEDATLEVGQKYILSTFDLGGCMKALPLIWKFPEEYKNHVITPGPFHTVMNYIGMLTGHKCMGSGYSEILLEAGLVTSGCLKSVLKGKVYAKALFCLKTVSEAMERLLIECFTEEENADVTNPVALLNAAQNCSRESSIYLHHFGQVPGLRRQGPCWLPGENGHFLAQLWLDVFLTNIKTSHPGAEELLKKDGIAVARRVNHRLAIYKRADILIFWFPKPYDPNKGCTKLLITFFYTTINQYWHQIWILETFFYKNKLSNLFSTLGATAAGVVRFLVTVLTFAGSTAETDCIYPTFSDVFEITIIRKKIVPIIKRYLTILQENMSKKRAKWPPNVQFYRSTRLLQTHQMLLPQPTMPSAFPIRGFSLKTKYPADNLLVSAHEKGEHAYKEFEQQRLQKGDCFHDPIKNIRLKTFSTMKSKPIKGTTKEIAMKADRRPLPWTLANGDGTTKKTNKAVLLKHLESKVLPVEEVPHPSAALTDDMRLMHTLHGENRTFSELSDHVFSQMLHAGYGSDRIDVIFYVYHSDSIKSAERIQRGSAEGIPFSNIMPGHKIKNWRRFLSCTESKIKLTKFPAESWREQKFREKLRNKCMFVTSGNRCIKLTAGCVTVPSVQRFWMEISRHEINTSCMRLTAFHLILLIIFKHGCKADFALLIFNLIPSEKKKWEQRDSIERSRSFLLMVAFVTANLSNCLCTRLPNSSALSQFTWSCVRCTQRQEKIRVEKLIHCSSIIVITRTWLIIGSKLAISSYPSSIRMLINIVVVWSKPHVIGCREVCSRRLNFDEIVWGKKFRGSQLNYGSHLS